MDCLQKRALGAGSTRTTRRAKRRKRDAPGSSWNNALVISDSDEDQRPVVLAVIDLTSDDESEVNPPSQKTSSCRNFPSSSNVPAVEVILHPSSSRYASPSSTHKSAAAMHVAKQPITLPPKPLSFKGNGRPEASNAPAASMRVLEQVHVSSQDAPDQPPTPGPSRLLETPTKPSAPIMELPRLQLSTPARTSVPGKGKAREDPLATQENLDGLLAVIGSTRADTPTPETSSSYTPATPLPGPSSHRHVPKPLPPRPIHRQRVELPPLPPSRRVTRSTTLKANKEDKPPGTQRNELQASWNAIAAQSNAASIVFVNEIDDEEVPPLPQDFEYMESEYVYNDSVTRQRHPTDFLTSCDCQSCELGEGCPCDDDNTNPYDATGLLNLQYIRLKLVVECNMKCSCAKEGMRCLNRVAQKPRDIPLEIYKTLACGWGVRSSVDVKAGKVIGLFTGEVITRTQARNLSIKHRNYCFDLDFEDIGNLYRSKKEYTVDAREEGNWTRFINHSCSPNLTTYFVVYDTLPEDNIYHIAFAANQDIPAGTEFTNDYDPGWVPGEKVSSSTPACHCRAPNCRGWYHTAPESSTV